MLSKVCAIVAFFPVVSQISCINQIDYLSWFLGCSFFYGPFHNSGCFEVGLWPAVGASGAAKCGLATSEPCLSCPWLFCPVLALSLRNNRASGSLALCDLQIHHLGREEVGKDPAALIIVCFSEPWPHPGNARPRPGGPALRQKGNEN